MAQQVRFQRDSQAEFTKAIRPLGERHSLWQVWRDYVTASAIAIDAPFNPPEDETRKKREAEYQRIMERYKPQEREVFPKLFALTVQALEDEPQQDFLGELFMVLELSNNWKGQFFTPYSVCQFMAELTMADVEEKIREKGWIGIHDCACGSGATLIAARNFLAFHQPPLGPLPLHLQALFVCQDVDRLAALMCYIQLSLLGCAGYVVVGDTLVSPVTGYGRSALLPVEREGQEIWTMPMFHDKVWVMRQVIERMRIMEPPTVKAEAVPAKAEPEEGQLALF